MKRLPLVVLGAAIATFAHAECDVSGDRSESIASLKEKLTCIAAELATLRAEVDILKNIEAENELLRAQLDSFRKSAAGGAVLRVTKVSREMNLYSFPSIRKKAVDEMLKRNAKLVQEGNQWIDFELNGFPIMLACQMSAHSACDVTVVGPGPSEDVNLRIANELRDLILRDAK